MGTACSNCSQKLEDEPNNPDQQANRLLVMKPYPSPRSSPASSYDDQTAQRPIQRK